MERDRILLTGGSGRLGTELRELMPDIVAPPRSEVDIRDRDSLRRAIETYRPETVVHAAAMVDQGMAEARPAECWATNVTGTANVCEVAREAGAFLVHISTDYVFGGTRGHYREDDPLGPPFNYYALTKIAAEAVVRTVPRHLIIRTSFRPRAWPYPKAFVDLFTSQDYVDVIAPQVAEAILHASEWGVPTLHIATERKSAFELARRRREDVEPGSRAEAPVTLPNDVSLDTSLWTRLRRERCGSP